MMFRLSPFAESRNFDQREQSRPPLHAAAAFIFHYLRELKGQFWMLAASVTAAAGCAVAVQYQVKFLVDAMAGPARNAGAVWTAVACFVALVAVESVLWRASGWLTCRTTIEAGVRMRLDLFAHLSGQSMRYFAENLAGSLGQRITATAGAFGALTNIAVWRIAPPVVDFIGGSVVLATIHGRMAVVMAVYVVAMTLGLIAVGQRGKPLHGRYYAKASEVSGGLVDVISNMWAVKAFTARRREWERLHDEFHQEAVSQRRSWMYTERTRLCYDLVMWMMTATMLFWAVNCWRTGTITAGDVVVIITMTFRILHGSRDVTLAFVEAVQQLSYMEDTLRVIGQVHSVRDVPRAARLRRGPGAIEFRDVTFGYESARPVLRNISVRIDAGEKVGIVGPSGAGKTTFAHLIQRLYDADSGEIWIDGQPIHQLSQSSLSGGLSVVPQEITLFHRSVRENIRFGRPDATDEEVYAAAAAARCAGFIKHLPEGYDTLVGERGTKLSGGQRQRIGIARALLKEAPILILDEATSALDTESELQIQRNIVDLLKGRTVIAVAHRLSTLTAFDRILVIHQGRIAEQGSAAELRRRGALFQKMWRMQAEGLTSEASARIA